MHARHRNPGEVARVNSFGVGQSLSRASSDSGLRHFSQPSDHKGFGRVVGRGPPKPQQPTVRQSDIILEAGRLAAEYLVSQGLLPASSLLQKGQNGNVAGLRKELHEVRVREREITATENGNSLCARSGGSALDVAASSLTGRVEESLKRPSGASEVFSGGKRKLVDDSMDCKSHFKDGRKPGGVKVVGQDWNREDGRSGLISLDKGSEFSVVKENDGTLSGYRGEKRLALDSLGVPKPVDAIPSKSEPGGDSDSDLENYEFPDPADSTPFGPSIAKSKELFNSEDPFGRKFDKVEPGSSMSVEREDSYVSSDVGEGRDSLYWALREIPNTLQQRFGKTDAMSKDSRGSSPAAANRGHTSAGQNFIGKGSDQTIGGASSDRVDLVQLCSLGQVPTKARSTARHRASDLERGFEPHLIPMQEGRNSGEGFSARGSKASWGSGSVEKSGKEHSLSCWTQDLRDLGSESGRSLVNRSVEEAGDGDLSLSLEKDRFARSHSFSDRSSFMHQQESSRWPPGFAGPHTGDAIAPEGRMLPYVRCRSMFPQRDRDNRGNTWEGAKRQKEWPSPRISQADEYFRLHNMKAKLVIAQAKGLPSGGEESCEVAEQKEFLDDKHIVKNDPNPSITSKPMLSDPIEDQQASSSGSKTNTVDTKFNQNPIVTDNKKDCIGLIAVQQKASAQVAMLLGKICENGSNEFSVPVLEGRPKDCIQLDEGKVVAAEPETKGMKIEEGAVRTFFQDLLKEYPLLRKLYQSQDASNGLDCLVCLGSASKVEKKFSNVMSLLKHVKDDNEMPLVHKSYGHAICDVLGCEFPKCSLEDGESSEQQRKQPLESEEVVRGTAGHENPSVEGAAKNILEN